MEVSCQINAPAALPLEKELPHPWYMRLGGSQSRFRHCGEEKVSYSCRESSSDRPARSSLLYWLALWGVLCPGGFVCRLFHTGYLLGLLLNSESGTTKSCPTSAFSRCLNLISLPNSIACHGIILPPLTNVSLLLRPNVVSTSGHK